MSPPHLKKKSAAVDRISDLPDEILCHILSFLSTKHAFTTSVLSKRWTPLCRLCTVLRFSDRTVKNDEEAILRFRRFVDRVMLSPRMQNQPIKTFRLNCHSKLWGSDHFKVNEWVETAKRHRVEVLRLYMGYTMKRGPSLGPSIFCCQTLVVLKLCWLRVTGNILSANLPSLKTLRLSVVRFQNQEDLKKLLFACPILEDLDTYISYIESGDVIPCAAGFNTLSKVVKACISQFDVPFEAIYNVEFLHISRMQERLSYEEIKFYYKCFPVFRNLIHLKLWYSRFVSEQNRIHGWDQVVWKVLQHCPMLQILLIKKSTYTRCFYTDIENWEYPNSVPECVSCHLRTCTIINYKGFKDDLRFTTYILKNARLLQVMTIKTINSKSYSYPTEKALEELSSIPRNSPGCKLLIQIN